MPPSNRPPAIDPARQSLLSADLVRRYARLNETLEKGAAVPPLAAQVERLLAGDPPREGESQEEADRREAQTLAWIGQRLLQERIQVGFLGRNQIGKSSTLNNILDVEKDRAPSEEGNFEATTSVITRLRFRATGGDTLSLAYLDEEAYRDKRNALCKEIGLDSGVADQVLLDRELPRRVQAMQQGEGRPALAEDPAYLEKLVRSYLTHRGTYLGRVAQVPFQDRGQHLNHNGNDRQPSPAMLIREAAIDFESALIDPRLELIDLPGLGAHISVDAQLSRQFFKNLDGALVFQSLKGLTNTDTEKIFGHLRSLYGGNYENRVWLVITYFDGLSRGNLEGSGTKDSVFEGVLRLASRARVPESQVCLVSNTLYHKVRKANAEGQPLSARERAGHVGVAEGEVPTALARHPALVPAFEALLEDGGIGRLRALLKDRMVPALIGQMERSLRDKLEMLCRKFREAIGFARKAGSMDLLPAVQTCLSKVVYPRLTEMQERPAPFFDQRGARLRDRLLAFFRDFLFSDDPFLDSRGLNYLADLFSGHCQSLRERLDQILHDPAEVSVAELYEQIGRDLPAEPAIPVNGAATAREAWDQVMAADTQLDAWFWQDPQAPTFEMPEFFPALQEAGIATFNGGSYRRMMQEKIRLTAQQTCHVLRRKLLGRLDELRDGLEAHLRSRARAGGASVSGKIYDNLLSGLEQVCP